MCYQNRRSLFLPSIACHPAALFVGLKGFVFKTWLCRKHLSFLCNSPCSSRVMGDSHAESCSTWAPWESHRLQGKIWHKVTKNSQSETRGAPSPFAKHKQTKKTQRYKPAMLTHLFTCYAGRSKLCVLWVSLWQRTVGRHFPGKEARNSKSVNDCCSLTYFTVELRSLPQLRCWWKALGCTGGCTSPA